MFSGEYLSSEKHHPLDFLQRIEDEWGSYMPETVQDRINILKTEFKFMDIFLTIQSFTNEPKMLNVTQKVHALFQDSAFDRSKLYQNLDRLTSLLQNKVWVTKLEIKANYSFFSGVSSQLISHEKNGVDNSKIEMKFINDVVQNLSELSEIDHRCSRETQEVLKELKLLRNLVGFLSNRWCAEPQSVRTFFSHVLFVAGVAAMVAWLYMPGHGDNRNQYLVPGAMKFLLSYLVRMRIKPVNSCIRKIYVDVLQALKWRMQSELSPNIQNVYAAEIEVGFVETLIHNLEVIRSISILSGIEFLNHQMATLEEMLKFLRASLIHLPVLGLEFHLKDINTVIVDVGLLIYSLYDSKEQEEVKQRLFLDLPKSIQHIKEVIFLVIRKAFQSNLPRLHGLGCVDFLLDNLKEFQGRYSESHDSFVKNQLQVIQKELKSLQPFLKDVAKVHYNKHERLQHCAALLNGKAYEVEYIVDASIRKGVPDWCLVRWLFDIIKEIILIRKEVAKIPKKKAFKFDFVLHDTLDTTPAHMSSELTNTPRMTNEEVVGFEDVMERLREQLVRGTKQLDVISVVGMPKLGKTTVAKKLYSDELVVSQFDIRAQCCVSQAYSRRNVLLSLLRDAIGESPTRTKLSTDVLADQLRKILFRKRYLILVDDVWETSVWDDLRCCFHDDNNGSRIILTTRHGDVAENAKSVSDPFHLRILNDDESWMLLKQKVFGEEVVGFEDVLEKLREQLVRGTKQLDVISVVGMPGLGKTTVANKLYSDELVVSRFDIRAQCCVSQAYSRRNVLLSLLRDAIGESPTLTKLSMDVLANQLRKILLRKRYLILVDDVWEASVWDDLRCCFHDDNNGSRIILTTRHGDVAENAKSVSDPFHLRILNDDESWMLLKQKIFGEESCSLLLSNVGKEIANKCRGLPLSIVLVAGMLTKMEKSEQCWKQVAMNLCTNVLSNSKAIIEQSYQNLPYHLKPCFLYFGVFLEDKEINTSTLTWLWISEGFIKSRDDKSLEDIAEGYLENLIRRNLVMVAKWSSGGKVKTCRIHDLLLYFCKERAKEKNLLLGMRWDQNVNTSSSIYSHKQLLQRHMSINSQVVDLVDWSSLVGTVRFGEVRNEGSFSIVQFSHVYFRFLKVLNLELIVIDSFPTELVYLRYFAAQTSQKSITSSIANLRNLETLIVKPMGGKLILPLTLLKMVKLRHLQIYSEAHFSTSNAAEELLENSNFGNLITLSSPTFCCVRDAELILRTPNLRKLRCSFVGWDYPSRVMSSLTRLETLSIQTDSCGSSPSNFPPNLKKLTLSTGTMFWLQKGIAMLPNLQVLKLVAVFFSKAEWEVTSNKFHQLKVLKVVDCPSFKKWNVSDDAFPCLEHLVLRRCRYLEAIPSRFGDITSLISIEVKSCNESLVESAMAIRETQVEEIQNYDFKVFIHK